MSDDLQKKLGNAKLKRSRLNSKIRRTSRKDKTLRRKLQKQVADLNNQVSSLRKQLA